MYQVRKQVWLIQFNRIYQDKEVITYCKIKDIISHLSLFYRRHWVHVACLSIDNGNRTVEGSITKYSIRRNILAYLASSRHCVEDLIENKLVTLPEDAIVADAVKIMKDVGISSILVRSLYSSSENPLITGIVTTCCSLLNQSHHPNLNHTEPSSAFEKPVQLLLLQLEFW